MSTGFKQLVSALQGDFSLIVEFLDNPQAVVSRYDLSADEKDAMLSRDFDALASLCGSQQMFAVVLSAAHTPLCSTSTITRAT